jgi:bifunctional non-homologous end joining protein LigD
MPDAAERLARYRAIRDFTGTPEPSGSQAPSGASAELRFVVQEHHATSLHWDLRLERDGVLVSWAVPKGIPPSPRTNHLAVHTEDHPLEYLTFEAVIPDGQYGAGEMTIWDTGTYQTDEWGEREVKVTFHGRRVSGQYVLFRTRGNQWMIHRMDPPADPDRQPWPGWEAFRPMLAVAGSMPLEDDLASFGFEIAWGGRRALMYVEGGRVRVHDVVADADISTLLPELRALGLALGTVEVVLDGELIVPGDGGRPDSARLSRRFPDRRPGDSTVRRLAKTDGVAYLISDLIWLEGHALHDRPYADRRSLLSSLALAGPAWQVPASHAGAGPALLAAASAQGLPGIVGKRLGGPYVAGPAPGEWILVPSSSS